MTLPKKFEDMRIRNSALVTGKHKDQVSTHILYAMQCKTDIPEVLDALDEAVKALTYAENRFKDINYSKLDLLGEGEYSARVRSQSEDGLLRVQYALREIDQPKENK